MLNDRQAYPVEVELTVEGVEENRDCEKNSTVNVENIKGSRTHYAWAKTSFSSTALTLHKRIDVSCTFATRTPDSSAQMGAILAVAGSLH
jgi:hypothetical protein